MFIGDVNTDIDFEIKHKNTRLYEGCSFILNDEFWYTDTRKNEVSFFVKLN